MKIPHIDENRYPVTGAPRPRFNPSPALRALGYQRRNLQHADGRWFSLGEALDFSNDVQADQARQKPKRRRRRARPLYTVAHLARDWRDPNVNRRWGGAGVSDGRMTVAPLSAKSRENYDWNMSVLERTAPDLWTGAVDQLDAKACVALFDTLWTKHGLAAARSTMRGLSAAIAWGIRYAPAVTRADNPVAALRMPASEPRLRVGTRKEIDALIVAADIVGLPQIGLSVITGLFTGQRQADRLAMKHDGVDDRGRQVFRQTKTGAIVAIKKAHVLEATIGNAMKRRAAAGVIAPLMIVNEATWQPYTTRTYNRHFNLVRERAVKMQPTLADFTDQDLRDTAVTWLARAGCDIPEICSITGHSLKSAVTVLRHYLALDAELADRAIEKLIGYYDTL